MSYLKQTVCAELGRRSTAAAIPSGKQTEWSLPIEGMTAAW